MISTDAKPRPLAALGRPSRFHRLRAGWLFVGLFLIAVPWYWRWLPISPRAIWWGVPAWFAVAVGGSFIISLTTAWYLRLPWDETVEEAAGPILAETVRTERTEGEQSGRE
jgi:hypothetical protein